MANFVDLTDERFQGSFGDDELKALKRPGDYILPVKYRDSYFATKCHVIYVSPADSRTQVIMIETENGSLFDLYYNGNEEAFKRLTYLEDEITFEESWENEDIWIECPRVFAKKYPGSTRDFATLPTVRELYVDE